MLDCLLDLSKVLPEISDIEMRISGRKKKLKTSSKKPKVTGDEVDTVEDDEDNHLGNSLESSQKRVSFLESPIMEDKPCTVNGGQGVASQLEGNVEKVTGSVEREKRYALFFYPYFFNGVHSLFNISL